MSTTFHYEDEALPLKPPTDSPTESRVNVAEIELKNLDKSQTAKSSEEKTMEEDTSLSSSPSNSKSKIIVDEEPVKDTSSSYRFNLTFLRYSLWTMRIGLGRPWEEGWLWFLVLINLLCQTLGAWDIQGYLYYYATGRDKYFPGISGCLKSGCGPYTAPGVKNGSPYVNSPHDYIGEYMVDFAWMFIIGLFAVGTMSVTGDLINVRMRARITSRLQTRLLTDKLWYRLSLDNALDNIDQRISSDLQHLLDGLTVCLFGNTSDYMIYPIFFVFSRMTVAYNLSTTPLSQGNQVSVVFSCLAMASVAMMAYVIPMNYISKLFGKGQRYEGDFRTHHTRVVLNCETIATLNGEAFELKEAKREFKRLADNKEKYFLVQGGLMFLKLIATITQPNVAYLILAVVMQVGSSDRDQFNLPSGFDSSSATTYSNFFIKQLGDILEYLLYFPAIIARLAFAAGAGHRLGELVDRMTSMESEPLQSTIIENESLIELKSVSANPPSQKSLTIDDSRGGFCCGEAIDEESINVKNKRSLFQDVNLRVEKGQSVVIMGPSGCGKSSLLRIIGGLWGIDKGTITIPSTKNMFFLPQRPYVFPATLTELITYPNKPSPHDSKKVAEILGTTLLSHLVDKFGLDSHENWPTILSISEQQRINFARLFFARPTFCLSDESSSAMDLKTEYLMLSHCNKLEITMISVAHRPSVMFHHKNVFLYDRSNHSWNLYPSESITRPEDKYTPEEHELAEDSNKLKNDEILGDMVEDQPGGISLLFWKRLYNIIHLGVPSIFTLEFLMILTMLFCMGVNGAVIIIVFRYYPTSGIITDVVNGNTQSALNAAGVYLGVNVVSAIVQSISAILGSLLTLRIQNAIINRFHSLYFEPQVPYIMNRVKRIRGIDQRMVQDCSNLRESLTWLFGSPFSFQQFRSGLIPQSITAIMLVGYAFSIAWSLTTCFVVVLFCAFLWQVISSFITSQYTQRKAASEGDLRLHYGRLLNNIESVTFFRGQASELAVADELAYKLETTSFTLMKYLAFTTFPSVAMYYWLQTGEYEVSAVMQLYWSGWQLNITDLFTIIPFTILCGKAIMEVIKALGGLGGLAGLTHRVCEVLEATEEQHALHTRAINNNNDKGDNNSIEPNDKQLSATGLAFSTPAAEGREARPLLKDVNFVVEKDSAVLIMGPSGCGKSGILRCISGLWKPTAGKIQRPQKLGYGGLMFAPQIPYAPKGSLATQLMYPLLLDESQVNPEKYYRCLEEVGLGEISEKWGLSRVANWELVLSGGEQQRLAMARVLFQHPNFLMMDEATSALDADTEKKVMNAVLKRQMGLLSVGSRPALKKYHKNILMFNSAGQYKVVGNENTN